MCIFGINSRHFRLSICKTSNCFSRGYKGATINGLKLCQIGGKISVLSRTYQNIIITKRHRGVTEVIKIDDKIWDIPPQTNNRHLQKNHPVVQEGTASYIELHHAHCFNIKVTFYNWKSRTLVIFLKFASYF